MKEETDDEVPPVRKMKRLTKLGEMVPVREGTAAGEVVPQGEGAMPEEEGREAGEGAQVMGKPRTGEEGEGPWAKMPLIIVSAE